jgi:hypothetical protein
VILISKKSDMLRHFLASIAYHATKAIGDASITYREFNAGNETRTPNQILHHITGVLTYAHSFYEHYDTTYFVHQSWDDEVKRFYEILAKLDRSFKDKKPREVSEEQLLQGCSTATKNLDKVGYPFDDHLNHYCRSLNTSDQKQNSEVVLTRI